MSARQRKERLKEKIDSLSECEHEQIFNIIRKHIKKFTCSDSGILISADTLPDECISEIEKYIDFCFAQQKRLDADEARRTELYKSLHNSE